MSGGFGSVMTVFAQGMAIVTIASPAIILLVVGATLAGRAVLRRLKTDAQGSASDVLISEEGWGKQIHRAGSAAPKANNANSVSSASEAPSPALDLSDLDEQEPERRRA